MQRKLGHITLDKTPAILLSNIKCPTLVGCMCSCWQHKRPPGEPHPIALLK